MSADLLAAFGAPLEPEPDHQTHNTGTTQSNTQAVQQQHGLFKPSSNGNDLLFDADADDGPSDDEFGDFEDVKSALPQESQPPQSSDNNAYARSSTKQNIHAGPEAPLIDLLSPDDEPPLSSAPAPTVVPTSWTTTTIAATVYQPQPPTTVSGDEGTLGTLVDDVWGDFVDIEQPETQSRKNLSTMPAVLSHTATEPVADTRTPPLSKKIAAAKPISKPESEPEPESEEDWSDFEDRPSADKDVHTLPQASPSLQKATSSPSNLPPSRPTNVPPPSLILSFLPATFPGLLRSDQAASEIICTFHAASHVIAGRSLRWKRDALLSQSTRIAAAGRPGGMKLASVNKGENLAEERESAELVEVWNRNLVKFQAALGKDKATLGGGGAIGASRAGLRLATTMAVKTATGPGILEAKVICALCGLKRNERIAGIDDKVEDAFGEFWVETWGHSACCKWWERWKEQLRQR